MDKHFAYKLLLKHSKTDNYKFYYSRFSNFTITDLLFDLQMEQREPVYFDYDREMHQLYKLLSQNKQREIIMQAFNLYNTSNDTYLKRLNFDRNYYLYHDMLKEDYREQITDEYVEFDTAIGLIVNLYNKFLCIQERMCQILPRLDLKISISNSNNIEMIDQFDDYFYSLRNGTDINIIQKSICEYIDIIMKTDYSETSTINDLLMDQWMIIGISHCLYYNEVAPSPSLKYIFDRWTDGLKDDNDTIIKLNQRCDNSIDDAFDENNLTEEYSQLSYNLFFVLRTVLSKKLYDYYKYFCREENRSE